MIVVLANENVIKQGTGGGEGVVLVWLLLHDGVAKSKIVDEDI